MINSKKAKQKSIIVFCAHPDDEVIGPGGTLKKYAKQGIKTIVVIISGGEKSNALYKKEKLIKIRKDESEQAAKILEVSKVINLGLRDMQLIKDLDKKETKDEIKNLIKKYQPEKIFTHAIDDLLYQDHKAVHDTIYNILEQINKTKNKKDKLSLYTFNVWTLNVRKRDSPKLIVDISDEFKYKLKALKKFKSQKIALLQLYPAIYTRAILSGWKYDTKYVEEFFKVL